MTSNIAKSLGVTATREREIYKESTFLSKNWSTLLVIGVLIVFRLFFTITFVSGTSMLPTYQDNQLVITSTWAVPDRFDVAVFREKISEDTKEVIVIKRVIGLPGDKIVVDKGVLYVNDIKIDEYYLSEQPNFKQQSFEIVVPEDHYFIMGDNRDNSNDSRYVGSFKKTSLVGKVLW